MAIVLTSTTEPQENLDHAASEKWREAPQAKAEPVPEVEPETEPVEVPEEPAEPVAEPEPEPETETEVAEEEAKPKGHKGGGKDKRIAKLTAINAQQAKELQEYRAREAAKGNIEQTPLQQSQQIPEPPKLADYKTPEEWADARDNWKAAKEKTEAVIAYRKEIFDTYSKKSAEALAKHDDWDVVAAAANNITASKEAIPHILETIYAADNGPDITYYLGTHLEEARELDDMTVAAAIRFINKISDKLAAEKEKPAPTKAKVQPPAPISPVTSSGTKTNVPLEQMSLKNFIRERNKQEIAKRKGL